jgi:hypothetical protein
MLRRFRDRREFIDPPRPAENFRSPQQRPRAGPGVGVGRFDMFVLIVLSPNLSPAIVILVYPYTFAPFNALEEPVRDDFRGGIFKALYFVQQPMIHLFDNRHDRCVHLGKVHHESPRVELSRHDHFNPVVVAMQIPASVAFRQKWKIVSGLETVNAADTGCQFGSGWI